jgi:hypothetical protein
MAFEPGDCVIQEIYLHSRIPWILLNMSILLITKKYTEMCFLVLHTVLRINYEADSRSTGHEIPLFLAPNYRHSLYTMPPLGPILNQTIHTTPSRHVSLMHILI